MTVASLSDLTRNPHPTAATRRRAGRPPAAAGTYHWAVIATAWGPAAAVWRQPPADGTPAFAEQPPEALLCRILSPGLTLPQLRHEMRRRLPAAAEELPDAHGRFHPDVVPTWFEELAGYLEGYFSSTIRDNEFLDVWATWEPRLDFSQITPFQRRILNLVAAIPRGQVLTYGQVARRAGRPQAARAVGAALRCNPWPILIPCHRVVGATGALVGFTAPGGVATKRRLLDLEQG